MARRKMDGLPVFDAREPTTIVLDPKNFLEAVPGNGDDCAIAKACQIQFRTPFVHIMRTMAYVALPDERLGVQVPGIQGKWVMRRYYLDEKAKRAVQAVDERRALPENLAITFRPVDACHRLGSRKKDRGSGGSHAANRGLRPNVLDLRGVRNYSGRSPH